VKTERLTLRTIEWGPLIIFSAGAALFSLGMGRFIVRHRFSLTDALHCCLAMFPAWLLLLVIAYVVQHARMASIIPLFLAGFLAFAFPVFDVAFGLALMGVIGAPAWSDWRTKKIPLESATSAEGENDPDRSTTVAQPGVPSGLQANPPEMSPQEREVKLYKLREHKSAGEQAYDDMYEKAHSSSEATMFYSEAKESFYSAIGLARELGLEQEVEEIDKRLAHVKAVFRSQFT
jgi:hypothetical protein